MIYQLTPIDQTEGLPDGWYTLVGIEQYPFATSMLFEKGAWTALPRTMLSGYLRPLPATIPLTKEIAGEIWEAALDNREWSASPDKQTYIDNLFNQEK